MVAPAPPLSSFPRSTGKLSARIRETWPLNVTRLSGKASGIGGPPGHAGDRCGRPSAPATPLEHFGTLAGEGSTTCLERCKSVRSTRTAPKGVAANHVMPLDAATQHLPWSETGTRRPPQTATGTYSVCAHPHTRNTPHENGRTAVPPEPARANPREGAPMPDEPRSLAIAAAQHRRWAKCTDRTAATAPARKAFQDRFEKQVDPNGDLDPAERAKRAAAARSAYFQDLGAKSAKARAARKAQGL